MFTKFVYELWTICVVWNFNENLWKLTNYLEHFQVIGVKEYWCYSEWILFLSFFFETYKINGSKREIKSERVYENPLKTV